MAAILIKPSANPASFMSLPGELRNNIYHPHFDSIFHEKELAKDAICCRVESLKPALAILSTYHAVAHEVGSVFWLDYILRCHWGFGARYDDDDRMAGFINAARKHTLDLDITFQKRNLNTSSFCTNVAWLALYSTFDMVNNAEAAKQAEEHWKEVHLRADGFVSKKLLHVGSRQNAILMKYVYHSQEYSWDQLRGYLVMLDWDRIFALAKSNAGSAF